MIFVLSEEFLQLASCEAAAYGAAIENLLTSHTQGWHVFAPSREIGTFIAERMRLSDHKAAILRHHILARSAELLGQARSTPRVIYCIPDGSGDLGADERCLVVPLSAFTDMEACLKSELLVENARRDGQFYLSLAEAMSGGRGRLPLRFDVVHGGGNTTADEIERRLPAMRPLLAIVDSDRRSPGGAAGETLQRSQRVMDGVDNPLKTLISLDVRSLENFVPLAAWRRACEGDPDALAAIEALQRVRDEEVQTGVPDERSMLRFYSLKRAVKLGDYRKSDLEYRARLRRYAEGRMAPFPNSEDDPARDSEELLPPVGGHALDRLLTMMRSNSAVVDSLLEELNGGPCWEPLQRVLMQVIAFGLGGTRIASAPAV
ncbi:MAG TPA: hypothetical protein VGW34_04625 [Allosphingosinicella sp.]|nr:hypothetical protein [Allosphingosinicella sp.]